MTSQATYSVSGMTCEHCVNAVKTEIGAIDGVTEVKVDLVPAGVSTVTVASAEPLLDTAFAEAIDEAGYEVVIPDE